MAIYSDRTMDVEVNGKMEIRKIANVEPPNRRGGLTVHVPEIRHGERVVRRVGNSIPIIERD